MARFHIGATIRLFTVAVCAVTHIRCRGGSAGGRKRRLASDRSSKSKQSMPEDSRLYGVASGHYLPGDALPRGSVGAARDELS